MTAFADGWAQVLATALIELGLEPADAGRIAQETALEAQEANLAPQQLFGPAWPYARELVDALRTPIAVTSAAAGQRLPRAPGAVLLRLEGVGKRYRRRQVLEGVDLTVRAGEVAAIVGANGCGKTTLLRICAGLIPASTGLVRRAGRVGYVPQDGGVLGLLTPQEHFELFGAATGAVTGAASGAGAASIRTAMARSASAGSTRRRARSTGEHLAARLSWRPDPRLTADRLSGGTRQKLNLILGELHAPDLLLLDEPYQGFDQGSYVDFWHQVYQWRDAGKGIVVVTHLLHELDRVDHIVDLTTIGEGR